MRWVENYLQTSLTISGGVYKWHVNGQSDLFGKDAWRSRRPLNGSFNISLVTANQKNTETCRLGFRSELIMRPSESAVLQYYKLKKQFELSYELFHNNNNNNSNSFICRRGTPLINCPRGENRCDSKWIARIHDVDNTTGYEYHFDFSNDYMSWYWALHRCRAIGGDLPTIESAAETRWIREQVLALLRRLGRYEYALSS